MYEAVMIAATGLKSQQSRIDVIANNVANTNTVAFKSARLDFKDALYTAGFGPAPARTLEPEGNQQKGHGVLLTGIAKDFKSGFFQSTERKLDFAIEGEGFFALENADGNTVYTRNGNFHLSAGEDALYLVSGEGYFVLDANGERVQAPLAAEDFIVGADGAFKFSPKDEETAGMIGVIEFTNATGLVSTGDGNYRIGDASGGPAPARAAVVRQGALEGSNVNLAEEMTRLIRTQRAFQLSSRALTTADEMEGIANNMKK